MAICSASEGTTRLAASVGVVAADLEVPVGVVLEGGYDAGALARGVVRTLDVLSGPPTPPDVALHPLTARLLTALAPRWGALG